MPEETTQRLKFEKIEKSDAVIIKLIGELDMYTLPNAQDIINDIISKKIYYIILDLSRLQLIDSAGIGFINGTLKLLKERYHGALLLCNLSAYIEKIISLLKLDLFIPIYEGPNEALAAIKSETSTNIEHLKRMIELEPNFADSHCQLGKVYINHGMYKEAEYHLKKAIEINPRYEEALLNLGKLKKLTGNLDEAKSFYEQALKINPASPAALFNLGIIENNREYLEKAREIYKSLATEHPDFADFRKNYADVLKYMKDYENAKKEYEAAIKLSANYAEAMEALGDMYLEMGKEAEAQKYYKKITELEKVPPIILRRVKEKKAEL